MKKLILYILLSATLHSIVFAQNMDWQWAHRFGGSNYSNGSGSLNFYTNQPHNLVLDAEGNSYLFGTYGSGTQINGEDLPIFTDNNCGAFVAKFDCGGNVVWHKAIARSGQKNCHAQYMILKNNHLYLQGTVHIDNYYNTYFLDTTVYGSLLEYYQNHYPDSLVFPWIPYSNYTYIMELDLEGNIIDYNLLQTNHIHRWILWDGANEQVPFTIDSDGNYYLLMKYNPSRDDATQRFIIKHNDIPITDSMTSNTYLGYYVLKFDSDFNFQYIKPLVDCVHNQYWSLVAHIYDMKCDSEDNIYLCGYIKVNDTTSNPSYPYDVELADDKHIYSYNKESHGFVMKMNSESQILWVSQTRNYGDYFAHSDFRSICLDEASGNIYISGHAMPKGTYNSPECFSVFGDNDTVINLYDGEHVEWEDYTDIIACYDTAGNYKWYSCPLSLASNIGELAFHDNKLYAANRWARFGLIFGGNTYYPSVQQVGTTFPAGYSICEWDLQGNMTNVMQIYCTGASNNEPYDTRINTLGEIYTAGRFENTIAFGTDTLFAYSESDMFIAKFGLPCQTYVYDTATYCYGEVVQGVALTASGDYTFAYPEGSQEFDSIVLVHATVLPPLTIGLNDTTVCTAQQFYLDACGEFDSYQWSTGGAGCTEMLQFDNACTQSVSLTVTRGECSATRTISITAQVCDGITEPTATAMSLYPNPATDIVSIFGDGFVSATVIDISGRTLLRTTAMQLDISGLRPGEYIVKVVKIDGETEELKLIKE
ncbi:MAG: T9SS type A sorting domain-containing protein [Bacteroidales bacterium]|nr:T9SS type A sorting domain-containing protein [Bacteroidales bacterium]